jgi:hypothetical protein
MESLDLTSLANTKIVNKQKGISKQKKDVTNIIQPTMSSKQKFLRLQSSQQVESINSL